MRVGLSLGLCVASVLGAQDAPARFTGRGPVFFAVDREHGTRVDVHDAAVLRRRLSVDLRGVPLREALDTMASQADVRFTYRDDDIPAGAQVTLRAESITLLAGLTEVLLDLGLDVEVQASGHLTLVRREGTVATQPRTRTPASVRLVGQVVDSATHAPVAHAIVRIDRPARQAPADANGHYTLIDLAPGTYDVTARRIGYRSATHTVRVTGDSATQHLDFALSATPMKLDEVVTTALGDQRRYQIGNDIGSINVDSLTPTTPVTSLTDVISARVPGVEVLEGSGEVGNGPSLRIRGNGSMVLQGDPIIIVDGVRQDNTPGGTVAPLFGTSSCCGAVPSPSRLNDIDFSDVESIDILKGPSAATEYGTDAANGVIVIKTKHSHPGAARWTVSAEQAFSETGAGFPNTYYAYGHTAGGNPTATQCPMVPYVINAGVGSLAGTCVVDSVVKFNALTNSNTTMFGNGNRQKYDVSVAGGSDAVRYYVAGGLANELGTLRIPVALARMADSLGLPKSLWRPNTDNQRTARANTIVQVAPTAELQVNASYLATRQQAPENPSLAYGAYAYAPSDNAADNFGYGPAPSLTPVYWYGTLVDQSTNRLTGNLAGHWTPTAWLSAHVTAGLDHGSQRSMAEVLPQIASLNPYSPASLGITNGTTDIYSFDGRASVTARVAPSLRAITSTGLQLVDTRTQATYAQSQSITSTNPTLNGATSAGVTQTGARQATLGGYIEEELGVWDRLFLTGALRIDAGSDFGSGYAAAVYPKASVSWLALAGGATTVRFRGAFGESGVQPPSGAALELYGQQAAYLNGAMTTTSAIINVVNAHLAPERSVEFEGGTDIGFWHDRVDLGLTAYAKTTTNALVAIGTGWLGGSFNDYENVGEVTNNGFEANLTATVLRSRSITWDVALNASTNHNNLVKLAPGLAPQLVTSYLAIMRLAPGTPLYGYAAAKDHWTNAYRGGAVGLNDVAVEDSLSYVGPSQPTRMASFSTHLGLWHGIVTLGALLDYRGGFQLGNSTLFDAANVQSDVGSVDPHAPSWEQRRDVATIIERSNGLDSGTPPQGFYEDASYVRFRELSLTLALPDRLARAAHVRTLSVTGAIRNVALWTRFTGGDPEVASSLGFNAVFSPTTNSLFANHDIRESEDAVPLSRYFVLRLNAGF